MRFMAIVKANKDSEAGVLPSKELLEAMGRFNEEMAKAGVLLAGEGLQPSSKGARVKFSKGKRTVIDGPFTETKELIAGFWLLQAKSKEEAIESIKRSPAPFDESQEPEIEIRQLFEMSVFFPSEIFPPEERRRKKHCAPSCRRKPRSRRRGLRARPQGVRRRRRAPRSHSPLKRSDTLKSESMCRNIRPLFNFDPPVTHEEVRAASLQS